jgi:hypothetical protein
MRQNRQASGSQYSSCAVPLVDHRIFENVFSLVLSISGMAHWIVCQYEEYEHVVSPGL